jgi:alcohol dehydrogenase (NADP+)
VEEDVKGRQLELRGGLRMPALGLGTWKAAPGQVGVAVEEAVRLGYRHLDCASIYGNEREVGAALARCLERGMVRREELFVTSKLWNDRHEPEEVLPALQQSLADLRLEHLDLYLVHWPVAQRKGVLLPRSGRDLLAPELLPASATWSGMEAALEAGLTRSIGLSNFSRRKLEGLCSSARVPPAVLQVELHPSLQQRELLEACRRLGVVVTAYSPLGSSDRPPSLRAMGEPALLQDPLVGALARRRNATPAQVLIA